MLLMRQQKKKKTILFSRYAAFKCTGDKTKDALKWKHPEDQKVGAARWTSVV